MRRIEFIPGIEAMRGNLSGKQNLIYPSNENKAYDAPEGKKSYAQNYRASYIGARRASDGRVYFSVKTKTCVNMTPATKNAMAVLGGAAACYNAIKLAGGQKWQQIQYNYENAFKSEYKSIRQYAMSVLMSALRSKSATITFGGPTVATFQNPWVSTAEQDITISNRILVKFWSELANNPQIYTIAGMKGVQHQGDTAADVADSHYNVLDVEIVETEVEGETKNAVKIGDKFVTEYNTETGEADFSLVGTDSLFIPSVAPAVLEFSNTFVVAEG